MRLVFRFLRPHWKLCLITVFLLIVDVVGALIIPTLASEMMREGEAGAGFSTLAKTVVVMALAAIISGAGGILSGYTCAALTARVGKDMREALYKKSLDLAVADFRTFGVVSITTRTVSDVTNIHFALLSSFQMILPVPIVFIVSVVLAFTKDWLLGCVLLAVLAVITVIAVFIMQSAAPLFRKQQKLLDKMSAVLLENITGVRVVRAFNKEEAEDTTDGELLLNNVNIKKMPQRQLRDKIAYVQQRAWLFAGTIAENLRYSNENATDEELWHALDVAQAGDFVRSLPDGLNSFVAQGSTNFSGGQKQRLSIARALVKKPECYIFDDSFSALDFKTDTALRKAPAAETKQAAVIIIAQRVSDQFSAIGACVRRAYVRVPR